MRKIIFILTAPLRWIKNIFGAWVNSANNMPAEWLRRQRIKSWIDRQNRRSW